MYIPRINSGLEAEILCLHSLSVYNHYANECQGLLCCLRTINNYVKGVRLLIKSLYSKSRDLGFKTAIKLQRDKPRALYTATYPSNGIVPGKYKHAS